MGWRDAFASNMGETHARVGDAVRALLAMPPADRIAMARELLAGTGCVVVRDVGEQYLELDDNRMHAHGWNACRAEMLGDDT